MPLRGDVTVDVDKAALVKLGTSPAGDLNRFWLAMAARVDTLAKRKLSGQYLKVRTGTLRSSQAFRVEVHGGLLSAVNENTAAYAAALHNGSRPHEIRGRRSPRRLLTGWVHSGAPVFTPVVHHPGTKAKPWLADSRDEVVASL